jgi:hypothetical protein
LREVTLHPGVKRIVHEQIHQDRSLGPEFIRDR